MQIIWIFNGKVRKDMGISILILNYKKYINKRRNYGN